MWLGPLAAAFQGMDESRLPACCRRDGSHHCAMDEQTAMSLMQRAQSGPAFDAPSRCPYYPRTVARAAGPAFTLASGAVVAADLAVQPHVAIGTHAARLQPALRNYEGRGPPRLCLA